MQFLDIEVNAMASTVRQSSLKRHLLVHAAGLAAVVLVAGAGWKAIALLHTRQLCLHEDLRAVADLVSKDRAIRAKHEQLARDIQSLHHAKDSRSSANAVPPNDAELLAELSKLANTVDLSIKSYSPGQPSMNGWEAQISATASYSGICRFLNGLSSTKELCAVTQCSIAAPQQDDGPCTLELTVRVVNPAHIRSTLIAAGSER